MLIPTVIYSNGGEAMTGIKTDLQVQLPLMQILLAMEISSLKEVHLTIGEVTKMIIYGMEKALPTTLAQVVGVFLQRLNGKQNVQRISLPTTQQVLLALF